MDKNQKQEILAKFKLWFKDSIIKNHKKNTLKLTDVKEFNINPFLIYYLSNYLEGNSDPESLAKVLILPRVLGTSITTTFGTAIQVFVTKVLDGYGSTTSGIDVEYIDQIDGRKKFCQMKSGPNALNKGDVKTIVDDFDAVKNLARTNSTALDYSDLVFALVYGERGEENSFIKQLEAKHVNVVIGEEFWYRFTGDKRFYYDLITVAGEVALDVDMKKSVDSVVKKLALQIEDRFQELFDNGSEHSSNLAAEPIEKYENDNWDIKLFFAFNVSNLDLFS